MQFNLLEKQIQTENTNKDLQSSCSIHIHLYLHHGFPSIFVIHIDTYMYPSRINVPNSIAYPHPYPYPHPPMITSISISVYPHPPIISLLHSASTYNVTNGPLSARLLHHHHHSIKDPLFQVEGDFCGEEVSRRKSRREQHEQERIRKEQNEQEKRHLEQESRRNKHEQERKEKEEKDEQEKKERHSHERKGRKEKKGEGRGSFPLQYTRQVQIRTVETNGLFV